MVCDTFSLVNCIFFYARPNSIKVGIFARTKSCNAQYRYRPCSTLYTLWSTPLFFKFVVPMQHRIFCQPFIVTISRCSDNLCWYPIASRFNIFRILLDKFLQILWIVYSVVAIDGLLPPYVAFSRLKTKYLLLYLSPRKLFFFKTRALSINAPNDTCSGKTDPSATNCMRNMKIKINFLTCSRFQVHYKWSDLWKPPLSRNQTPPQWQR